MYRCANGHFVPLYLSKIGTLNFGGSTRSCTRLILLASTRLYAFDPSTILKRSSWAQVSVGPRCFRTAPMILSLSSLVPLDRQGTKLLLGQSYLPLSSIPLRSLVREGVHSRIGNFPFEAWAAFIHMGSESLWIGGILPSLIWVGGTTLQTDCLCFIPHQGS